MAARTKPLCIYHKNCLDGRGAAAVVQRKERDCDFVAMQYGTKRPAVLGRKLYIVDFCLSLEEMRAVRAEATEVIWIDHHASQQSVHKTLGWGILDTEESGASLTWRTLFPDEPVPPVIAYIKDKDLWQWRLPDSRAVAAGLLEKFKGDSFAGILDVNLDEMIALGKPLLDSLAARVSETVKTGVLVENPFGMRGMRAMAVNCNKDLNETGEHICLPTSAGGLGYDLAIMYYQKRPGMWVHSLRSAGVEITKVDCARIASMRGGGGHPNAACYLAGDCFPHLPPTQTPKAGHNGK